MYVYIAFPSTGTIKKTIRKINFQQATKSKYCYRCRNESMFQRLFVNFIIFKENLKANMLIKICFFLKLLAKI